MRIEDEQQDVLQHIEFAVARLYRLNPVKSVNRWTKRGGRHGYLNFRTQFVK